MVKYISMIKLGEVKKLITDNNLIKILEKSIKENIQIIEELLKIDCQYCKIKTTVDQLIEVIQNLKHEEVNVHEEQKVKIIYNGNPCITINLCILAILTQNTIILDYGNNMKGINSFIIQTVNNLQACKLVQFTNKGIVADKTIIIDDINKYNLYLRQSKSNIKFYSHSYIDFYSDCDEYEEIEELIYKYADENQITIEVYSELEVTQAVQMIKNGLGKLVVVLTDNNETKQVFKENITNKELYINKNPFKENIRLINKEIFSM